MKSYPTFKWFGFNKDKPEDYNMDRDADDIKNFALGKIRKEIDARDSKKSKKPDLSHTVYKYKSTTETIDTKK